MKFTAKEDTEAPIDVVFDMLSEFDLYEKAAMRRGVAVQRVDSLNGPCSGMMWDVTFMLRGKPREMSIQLRDYEAPYQMTAHGVSKGVDGTFSVDLIALSKNRTRIAVDLDFKPQTLSARLMIQSLRLAKASLNTRFKQRLTTYAREIESRYKSGV